MTTPTILFVDDEENILKALQRLFIDEDYDIHVANSGNNALKIIKDGLQPTVIVSDQRMPKMGGADFLAQAKKIVPDSVRMVLTGYANINAAMNAINRGGIYRYILKPWNDHDLKLSIQDAVQHYNLVHENRQLTKSLAEKNLELAQLNVQLEKKVEERTIELHRKITELKGRDHIQQYLLAVHPLPKLLNTVLEVVIDVTSADGAAFYMFNAGHDAPKQIAAINFAELEFDSTNSPLTIALLNAARPDNQDSHLINFEERDHIIVAIHKGKKQIGTLVVRATQDSRFTENDLHTITSFGQQAAIGINDSRLQENFDEIETSLDDILAENILSSQG